MFARSAAIPQYRSATGTHDAPVASVTNGPAQDCWKNHDHENIFYDVRNSLYMVHKVFVIMF